MNKFKVGDWVNVYRSSWVNTNIKLKAVITHIFGDLIELYLPNIDESELVHYKQCRKLKQNEPFPRKGDIWISGIEGKKVYISDIRNLYVHFFIIDNNRALLQYLPIKNISWFKKYLGTWEIKENLIED